LEDAMQASFKPNKNSNTKLDQIVMRGGKSQKEVTLSISDLIVPFKKGQKNRRVGTKKILLNKQTTVPRRTNT
jgi:hypothetical protein